MQISDMTPLVSVEILDRLLNRGYFLWLSKFWIFSSSTASQCTYGRIFDCNAWCFTVAVLLWQEIHCLLTMVSVEVSKMWLTSACASFYLAYADARIGRALVFVHPCPKLRLHTKNAAALSAFTTTMKHDASFLRGWSRLTRKTCRLLWIWWKLRINTMRRRKDPNLLSARHSAGRRTVWLIRSFSPLDRSIHVTATGDSAMRKYVYVPVLLYCTFLMCWLGTGNQR